MTLTPTPTRNLSPPFDQQPIDQLGAFSQPWVEHHQALVGLLSMIQANQGVTDGSDATAGRIGEYLTASRSTGSATFCPSGTPVNVASIALTAGDWDVEGTVWFGGTSMNCNNAQAWVSTVSAAQPAQGSGGYFIQLFPGSAFLPMPAQFPTGALRVSTASPMTVWLGALTITASGTMTVAGTIRARRAR